MFYIYLNKWREFMNISFKEWLQIVEGVIHSVLKANPKSTQDPTKDFLVLFGNHFDAKDTLKNMGFRYFRMDNTWSMPRFAFDKLSSKQKEELKNAEIDISPMTMPREKALGTKSSEVTVDQDIKKELEEIKDLAKSGQTSKIEQLLDNLIEEISNLTDEAKKSELIKNFLEMSSKLYKYSPRNQWLIFAQNPKVTDVQSKTNWAKVGRKIKEGAEKNRMIIFAPWFFYRTERDETTGEEKKVKSLNPTRFIISYVYDISDTEVMPNAKTVYNPHSWRQDSNEPVEELAGIINALIKFAEENKIPISFDKMDYAMGGYATAHGIHINNEYDGINKASTLVHELAHNLMHFVAEKLSLGREEAEHDAESIAYVFLKHFGFSSKDSPTYLALWKADKDKIKSRSKGIKDTVSQLIKAVEKYYKESDVDYDHEDE